MASIRRTLSPYRDRPRLNGANPFPGESPSPKAMSNAKSSFPFMTLSLGVRRLFTGVVLQKSSRKSLNSLKHSFYRCLAFFLLGILLGMAPSGRFEDAAAQFQGHDYSSIEQNIIIESVKKVNQVEKMEVDFALDKVELRSTEIDKKKEGFGSVARNQLIVVTPTYNRAFQAYFLHRLGQVLRLVQPSVLWIVVEMNTLSMETADILKKTGVVYRHLVCSKNLTNIKDRGVHQRNTALEHIEHHKLDGIVYFADDDNIYTLELFETMRNISRFGTWPVAMLAQSKNKAILEGPVCNGSRVIGWHTNEKSKQLRRFHVDMSGFAFNSTILWDPKRWRRPTSAAIRQLDTVKEGFQETTFIQQVVEDESQMEGIPHGCSRIMNWHLHLEARKLLYPKAWQLPENLDVVVPTG